MNGILLRIKFFTKKGPADFLSRQGRRVAKCGKNEFGSSHGNYEKATATQGPKFDTGR